MTITTLLKPLPAIAILFGLYGCASQPETPPTPSASVTPEATIIKKIPAAPQEPPMTINKAGKNMPLVKIMEGGACKNPHEGAKGTFLLYADPDDIQRIKKQQGKQAFAKFEQKITDFSVFALQKAVNTINFAASAHASDPETLQQQLTAEFSPLFQTALQPKISEFEAKTGLHIDIQIFAPELVFYQHTCEATISTQENESAEPGKGI